MARTPALRGGAHGDFVHVELSDQQGWAAPQFAVLGLICVLLNTGVDLIVVLVSVRLMPYLRSSPRPAQMMSYGSGSVMIGLGTYLALSEAKR